MPEWGWFGATATADNEEVEHTSGLQRLCNSMIMALCGPFVILLACFICGWNEKRAVCGQKAILAGQDEVKLGGCDTAEFPGELVLFSCPYTIGTAVGAPFSPGGDFSNTISFDGLGIKVTTEMKQCVELKTPGQSKTASGGGGGKTTVSTYTYKADWMPPACSSCQNFHQASSDSDYGGNCGSPFSSNPMLPSDAPASITTYATSANIGPYTVMESYLTAVPLTVTQAPATIPSGWSRSENSDWYESQRGRIKGNEKGIGDVRTKFFVHDATETYTVLGKNNGGTIETWEAPSDWLCSGFKIGEMKPGKIATEEFFKSLLDENEGITFFLRFLSILIFWCGFAMIFAPLGVLADCVPCIGPCLGDFVEAVVCMCSCPPACACCLFVGGIVWIAMRPMLAIPLMLIGICTPIGYMIFKMQAKKNGKVSPGGDAEAPPAAPAAPAAQPAAPPPAVTSYSGPIPQDKAVSLIQALRQEYCNSVNGAVGTWIDGNADHGALMEDKERQVQEAGDKEQTIQAIEKEWGLC